MRFGVFLCLGFFTFFNVSSVEAQIDYCGNFPHSPRCVRNKEKSAGGVANTTVNIKRVGQNKTLNPRGLYRVEFVCSENGVLPVETKSALLTQNITASLLIGVSDTNTGAAPTPQNSKAILSVYNIGGVATNRTSYVNQACNNHPFFISPRRPLYLTAATANVKTNELGTIPKVIEGAVNIVSSVWPLFTGLPIPAAPATRLTAVKNTSGPVDAFISIFDAGLTDTKSMDLREGRTTISSDYATVEVYVTAIRSIVGVSEQFKTDLEDRLETMVKLGVSGTSTIPAIRSACLGAAETLKTQNNFSREDIAYSLMVLGRKSGFVNASQFINCLGYEYAAIAAKSYSGDLSIERRFSEDDVPVVLPGGISLFPQPEFKDVKTRLEGLMRNLRKFAAQTPLPEFSQSVLAKTGMANEVGIQDEAEITGVSAQKISSSDLLKAFKEKGFVRFGCLSADNDSLMFFLALPEKPINPEKGFSFSETLVMRGWINKDTKLNRVEIIRDEELAATVSSTCKGTKFAS